MEEFRAGERPTQTGGKVLRPDRRTDSGASPGLRSGRPRTAACATTLPPLSESKARATTGIRHDAPITVPSRRGTIIGLRSRRRSAKEELEMKIAPRDIQAGPLVGNPHR